MSPIPLPAGPLSRIGLLVLIAAAAYALVAYVVLPAFWTRYERQPGLKHKPMLTVTAQGIPGDPLNVGLVGDRATVVASFGRAGWSEAKPLGIAADARIAESVVLDRPDPAAPVSALYYDGRKEDLAFELSVGGSADQRHHIRLWQVMEKGSEGAPVWLGSASFDARAGFSHRTGQITHHISADLDAERAFVIAALEMAGAVSETYVVPGIGPTRDGRNGEGDRYETDGNVVVAVLKK